MVPSGLTFEEYSPHRAITFTMLNVVSSVGFYGIYKWKKIWKVSINYNTNTISCQFCVFAKRYIINFPIERSEVLHYPFREVSQFAWENYDKYDQTYLILNLGICSLDWNWGTILSSFLWTLRSCQNAKEFKIGVKSKRNKV